MLKRIAVLLTVVAMFSIARADGGNNGASKTTPVKRIGVYVLPYYQSAQSPDGRPTIDVAKAFNTQLASNNKDDILTVRDAIQSQPQRITPMTLMVLAIRLYDVGLRDDAVFWFYVAKNRYITMSDVLNVRSPGLSQVNEAVKGFATLAGPFINSYAFCDLTKQRDASTRAITWVEKNPYEIMFMEQLPALPGDRSENLKKSIASLKESAQKEQQYLSDPKNQEEFQKKRNEQHVPEQFCWPA
jgi:hypothetical protein